MATAGAPKHFRRAHVRLAQLVVLPLAVAVIGTAAAGGTTTISVRSGETLSGIAASHNTTVEVLQRLNHLIDADLLQVGQRLLIPAASPAVSERTRSPRPAATPVAEPASATRIVTYVVRSGDTLTAIAGHFKVALAAVSARNHLRPDGAIYIGQRLQVEVPVVVKDANNTFAGRTYPPATVAAANRHRSLLAQRPQPSPAETRALILRTAS